MSIAAGEYVSVSSQADPERADIARETRKLRDDRGGEVAEVAAICVERGLHNGLTVQLAEQLTARDAFGAHAGDELGISPANAARPVQAALASAASFAVGAALPLATALLVRTGLVVGSVSVASLLFLSLLGAVGDDRSSDRVAGRDRDDAGRGGDERERLEHALEDGAKKTGLLGGSVALRPLFG